MAVDMFMKIGGIAGEVAAGGREGWIEVLSLCHGLTQPSTVLSSGAAGTVERSIHQDFSIVHHLYKATPKLALFVCNGKHIPEITIELAQATGEKQKFMAYKLTDVIVSSVKPQGSAQGTDERPLEEVTFNYGKIEWTFTELDRETGKPIGDVTAFWDVISNKGG